MHEDTQIVSSEQSPIRRPASPDVNFVSVAVADAWQALAFFHLSCYIICIEHEEKGHLYVLYIYTYYIRYI